MRRLSSLALERTNATAHKTPLTSFFFLAFAALLFSSALVSLPSQAFAHEDDASCSCTLTDEQFAEYTEDGTLDERIAFQESLENDTFSTSLIEAALLEESGLNTILSSVPTSWESGMATIGEAHVLAVRVSFPDYTFEDDDTLAALQALIGPTSTSEDETTLDSSGDYPYESLYAYYDRSSYGQLTITGEAFDYVAKYDRDYYSNDISLLYDEILQYLDKSEDLTRFDANDDGRLDGVYLHFAGEDTGWGSVWWSNEQSLSYMGYTYEDGDVQLWNVVSLAVNSSESWAAQTIIHETGHVLGLPDYYSYVDQGASSDNRSGILTFDMMYDNQGDHNGFSKWLLGWIDDDDIVKIIANDEGTTVTQGDTVIAQAEPGEPVTQTLEAFTSEDSAETTGGIIIIANEDEGIFSSYYLLQYDEFAGNQSVCFELDGVSYELPSGFRLYRVQAELTSDESNYLKTNTGGTVHNQLIELVDPDMTETHISSNITIPVAIAASGYGCMFYEGDSVSPEGYPSTNFYENINLGFTGLTISFTESISGQGTIEVSYSDELMPDVPTDLTLTPLFETFSNVDTLYFEASSAVSYYSESYLMPYLVVDGNYQFISSFDVAEDIISVPLTFDAVDITPSSTCQIIFPAGMFIIAQTATETYYSPEICIELEPSELATLIERAGTYSGTNYYDELSILSDLVTCEDGSLLFAQISNSQLLVHTLDNEDPSQITTYTIECDESLLTFEETPTITALELSDSTIFVAASTWGGTNVFWIDLEEQSVWATYSLSSSTSQTFVADGNDIITTSTFYGASEEGPVYGSLLTLLSPQEDEGVEVHYGWASSDTIHSVSNTSLASGYLDDETVSTISVYVCDAQDVAESLRTSTYGADEAYKNGDSLGEETARVILPANVDRYLVDASESDTGFALLFSNSLLEYEEQSYNMVITYDQAGVLQEQTNVLFADNGVSSYANIALGNNGTVALQTSLTLSETIIPGKEVLFLDTSLETFSTLITASSAQGAWTSNGNWLDIGYSISEATSPKGSPAQNDESSTEDEGVFDDTYIEDEEFYEEDEGSLVYYTLTQQIDTSSPDDPDTPDTPDTPDDPDNPDSPDSPDTDDEGDNEDGTDADSDTDPSSDANLAATGDSTVTLALLASATVISLIACLAFAHKTRQGNQ